MTLSPKQSVSAHSMGCFAQMGSTIPALKVPRLVPGYSCRYFVLLFQMQCMAFAINYLFTQDDLVVLHVYFVL